MTTHSRFSSIAFALVFAAAVFTAGKAKADLVPGADKRLSVACGPGNSETIDASGFRFLQQVVDANPAAKTPELLALLHDSTTNTYPNLERGAVQAVCYQGSTPVNWFDPVEWKVETPEALLELADRYDCTRIEYGFGRHGRKILVVREIPPCQRGRADCDEYVGGLETRLATANSCTADELYDPRANKCVKGAAVESEFVANLQQAVAQEGAKYAKLRSAIADCENGRVTLDEQGNPVCNPSAKVVGIVWPWQLLSAVLAVLCVFLYRNRRSLASRLTTTLKHFAQAVSDAVATANRLKDEVIADLNAQITLAAEKIAGLNEELRLEREGRQQDKRAGERLDAVLASVGTLVGVRPGNHDTDAVLVPLKRAADVLGITIGEDGNPSEDLPTAAERVAAVASSMAETERREFERQRTSALEVLGYDGAWTMHQAAADLVKKVHDASGTPKDKRASTTPWAAVAALEEGTRGFARRVRVLVGRLGRVGLLLEVTFDGDSEAADEILPALGKLRNQLGIVGVGTGYNETIPAAVARIRIAREAAENAVETLRVARTVSAAAESVPVALAPQPSPSEGNGHDNGARKRAVEGALREIQNCASHAGQPNRQRRILAALEVVRQVIPALAT